MEIKRRSVIVMEINSRFSLGIFVAFNSSINISGSHRLSILHSSNVLKKKKISPDVLYT